MSRFDGLLYIFSPAAWLGKKMLSFFIDSAVKSPLEQDFGEASMDDIIPPDASTSFIGTVSDFRAKFIALSKRLEGIRADKLERLLHRVGELRAKRTAEFSFHIRHNRETVELRVVIDKIRPNELAATFQSNLAMIGIVEFCFREDGTE